MGHQVLFESASSKVEAQCPLSSLHPGNGKKWKLEKRITVEVVKYGREGEAARGTTLVDHQVKIAGQFLRISKVTPMMEGSSIQIAT